MIHVTLGIIFSLLLVPGIFLVFIPAFPSLFYMLFVAFIYGAIDTFVHLTWQNLIVLSIIFVLSVAVDWIAGTLGARLGGATLRSMMWGVFGTIAGIFVFPPLGGIIGLFVGIFISEIMLHREAYRSVKAATGGLIGVFAGMFINSGLALVFLILFVFFTFN
jgi:uncharacterized protein